MKHCDWPNAMQLSKDNRPIEKGKPRPISQKVGSFTISRFLAHRNTLTYDYYYDCTKKETKKEKS